MSSNFFNLTNLFYLDLLWSGKGKEVVVNFGKYLERFRQCLHYKKYRYLGLPIGSGEIESSHRYIPQKRDQIPLQLGILTLLTRC